MFSKILVPLDGSRLAEQILPYARLLAEVYEIPVELLRVQDAEARPPFWPPLPSPDYLQQIAVDYFPSSLRVGHVEESGRPADVIVDRGKTDPSSLIAMVTHGLSGIRRWLLGSVASQVVQCAANPVLLIRSRDDNEPASAISLKTVFVPLDGSPLAERILPHIVPLAARMKLEVNLVRVYSSPADAYPVADAVYMETLARHRETIHREAQSYLDAKAEELRAKGLDRVIAVTIPGDPAEEIIGLACNTPDSLIAMSTHGRSGVGRWVLGSVAEKVVQYSRDPVLIVRPNEG